MVLGPASQRKGDHLNHHMWLVRTHLCRVSVLVRIRVRVMVMVRVR